MKSAVISVFILLTLVAGAYIISAKQESILVPVYYTLKELDENGSAETLEQSIKSFEDNSFIIELAVPNDEYDRVLASLKQTAVFLKSGSTELFNAEKDYCLVYLSSILGYSDTTLDNIM
ncbi:MAG: hypothetical protein IKV53_04765 [Clostridia bacterium]|nr:hypothetical protein [Clostridia bacterium]